MRIVLLITILATQQACLKTTGTYRQPTAQDWTIISNSWTQWDASMNQTTSMPAAPMRPVIYNYGPVGR